MERTKFIIDGPHVSIRYPDGETRSYATVGEYVYDTTKHPGSSGRQVLDPRGPRGTTLMGPKDPFKLADLLRRCLRASREQEVQAVTRREGYLSRTESRYILEDVKL